MSQASDAPSYHYDQKLGDPHDAFTPANVAFPELRQPEMPATFVARVDGETLINSMWGKRAVAWHADPGTQCVILGYWADGTVQLRWPAISGAYRVEGRFPGWVVQADPDAPMAAGGHILRAHDPGRDNPPLLGRLFASIGRALSARR
jgi:hypothetical protein